MMRQYKWENMLKWIHEKLVFDGIIKSFSALSLQNLKPKDPCRKFTKLRFSFEFILVRNGTEQSSEASFQQWGTSEKEPEGNFNQHPSFFSL